MTALLTLLGDRTVLLWFAGAPPPKDAVTKPCDPMLVDADMVERIRAKAGAFVQSIPDPQSLKSDQDDLLQTLASRAAAKQLMGPNAHLQAAQALQETCMHLLS